MKGSGPADLPTRTRLSPEVVDRVLVGLCVLIWLGMLGMSVAAVVALVDLGRGFHEQTRNPHTGLLYIIIGVSALIILVAIPVLLRARQVSTTRPAARPVDFPPERADAPPDPQVVHSGSDPRATARPGPAAPVVREHAAKVNRVLLRGVTELTSILGAALTAVAVATYLMAVGKDGASWIGYGVAAFITATMPVVPWWHLRQLQGLLATTGTRTASASLRSR